MTTDPTEPTGDELEPGEFDGVAAKEDGSVRMAFNTLSGRISDIVDRLDAMEHSLRGKLQSVQRDKQDNATANKGDDKPEPKPDPAEKPDSQQGKTTEAKVTTAKSR